MKFGDISCNCIIKRDLSELENAINDFFDHNETCELKEIKYSSCVDEDHIYYSAMIIYRLP